MNEIPTRYNTEETEKKWIKFWDDNKTFQANIDSKKPKFTIVIPPPNVTGILTVGHVLNLTLQDIIIRTKKLQGYEVLWLPGTDHAGIATSGKVESELRKKNLSRFGVGREKFVSMCWDWTKEYHKRISAQMRRLCLAVDWSRERFTLDEKYVNAVLEAFVRLYEDGLIYRDEYIVNLCPFCMTVISNEEIQDVEEKGHLWYIKYPLKKGGFLTVATTRPETMLGDTALAVNPADARYKQYIGEIAILPIMDREIPIIADSSIDISFGTGVVKVTPAHDPLDFLIGKRHKLQSVIVIDKNGKINDNGGKFKGLDRFEARKNIIDELKEIGLLEKEEPYTHSVGHCKRCNTIVEPFLSKQWFVSMKELGIKAKKVVEKGKIKFYLPRWKKVYYHWIDNIVDWPISRQLWWGHRIPVYYCKDCGNIVVSKEKVEICPKCFSKNVYQDEDVLDTWFSSWLWPFASLGWPEKTKDIETFFPTDVLVTGWDIIFLWVARMIMASLKFMDGIPFKNVYFNGMVRDEKRRKLSKSLGNSVDPMHLISNYGSDALRIGIILITPEGQDVIYREKSIETGRNFLNKIWNAYRFISLNRTDSEPIIEGLNLSMVDRWIISKTMRNIEEVENALNEYRINDAARRIYDGFWSDFCDWYLEIIKTYLKDENQRKRVINVSMWVLDNYLKMLYPFTPCISEEIYNRIHNGDEYIHKSHWPIYEKHLIDEKLEEEFEFLQEFVINIRNIKGDFNIKSNILLTCYVDGDKKLIDLLNQEEWIKNLSGIKTIKQGTLNNEFTFFALKGLDVYVQLKDIIDLDKERERITTELEKIETELGKVQEQLKNKMFLKKAPEEIITSMKEKKDFYKDKIQKLKKLLKNIDVNT